LLRWDVDSASPSIIVHFRNARMNNVLGTTSYAEVLANERAMTVISFVCRLLAFYHSNGIYRRAGHDGRTDLCQVVSTGAGLLCATCRVGAGD